MDKKAFIENAVGGLRNINRRRLIKKANEHRFSMLEQQGIELKKLTDKQKKEVDAVYKKYGVPYKYITHQLVYSVTGEFDPYIVPEDFFRVCIDPVLCEYDLKHFLSDKNYFNLFMPDTAFPKTIVRNIRGNFYNEEFRLISKNDAKKKIQEYDSVVVKPSYDSGSGKSVELIDSEKVDNIFDRKKDYVVQQVLKQHSSFAKLNESSVNVVRIVTLFINNKVRVVTSAMRVGGVGDFTDNVEHKDGSGMTVIGIEDGKLKKLGYHSNGSRVTETPGGVKFEGYEVVNYDKMVQTAVREHEKFPQIGVIGWDITLDSDGNVVVMEYNIKSPGVIYYQYVNGPLFGTSTKELLDYIYKNKKK